MDMLTAFYQGRKYEMKNFVSPNEGVIYSIHQNDYGLFKYILNNNPIFLIDDVFNVSCRLGRVRITREIIRRYSKLKITE